MQVLSLAPFSLIRPEKVVWSFPQGLDHLALIPSKSLRKILREADALCQAKGITWELKPLTKDEYLFWLSFYEQRMHEQGHEIFAREQWFDEKLSLGTHLSGLFFWQGQEFLGGGVISETSERLSLAYKATSPIRLTGEPNANLGSVLDFFYQRYARSTGKPFTSGTSRNSFGALNALGYLNFKLRLGYSPQLPAEPQFTSEIPLGEGPTAFFGMSSPDQPLAPYLFLHSSLHEDDVRELQNRLPELKVLELS